MTRVICAFIIVAVANGCSAGGDRENATSQSAAIVGGGITGSSAKPKWLVRLGNSGGHFCGGMLLSAGWVLTAAHCVKDAVYPIAGTTVTGGDRVVSTYESTEQTSQIAFVVAHPGYALEGYNHINDLALIRLSEPFTLNANVGVVAALASTTPEDGTWGVAYGWGATVHNGATSDQLRHASMQVVPRAACQALWEQCDNGMDIVVNENQFCAYVPQPYYTSINSGDSGGPFVQSELAGITSMRFVYGYCPGIFVDVSKYTGWIDEVLHQTEWLEPIADTYVRGGSYAGENYGDAVVAEIKNDSSASFVRQAYMIFDLSGLSGSVESASLFQSCYQTSSSGAIPTVRLQQLYSGGEGWDEYELTWNNKYSFGNVVGSRSMDPGASITRFEWTGSDLRHRVEQQLGGAMAFRQYSITTSPRVLRCATREAVQAVHRPILRIKLD